jgi:salicylate hydroxylase
MTEVTMSDPRIADRKKTSIAVIGAGIGGVTAALFLHRAGFTVDLYDQATAFGEVGGTIGIDSHSVQELRAWNAQAAVEQAYGPLNTMEVRSMSGALQHTITIPGLSDIGVEIAERTTPHIGYGIQRWDLHADLLKQLPAELAHPGMRLASVADRGTHAEARFEDGMVITPDVLIGADGIRSRIRKLFTDVEAVRANVTICRGLVPASILPDEWENDRARRWEHPLADGGSVNALMGPTRRGTHIGVDTSLYHGEQLLDLDSSLVPIDRLLSLYPEGTDPFVLRAVESSIIDVHAFPLYDLPIIQTWCSEHIALLGDAAHAMRPLLAQGANQAIQDAAELTRALIAHDDVSAALAAYERVREPFTNAIKRASYELSSTPRYGDVYKSGRVA